MRHSHLNETSLISGWRQPSRVVRATTGAILCFFLWSNIQPALAAVRNEIGKTEGATARDPAVQRSGAHKPAEMQLVNALGRLKLRVAPAHDLVMKRTRKDKNGKRVLDITIIGRPEEPEIRNLQEQLGHLAEELQLADQETLADFGADAQFMRSHHLPQAIIDRHDSAVAQFKANAESVQKQISTLRATTTAVALYEGVTGLQKQLGDYEPRPITFDPKDLASRSVSNKVRAPSVNPKDRRDLFNRNVKVSRAATEPLPLAARRSPGKEPEVLATAAPTDLHDYYALARRADMDVASVGSMAGLLAAAVVLPGPEYLGDTEDVHDSAAIQDLAAQLHHNPVEVYNWVHNNIEFVPTYGSIQGSEVTLQTKHGNAFDTSSLLIALLRASGIPARYVYGTVQVPVGQAMNWVGGVSSPDAAADLLSQGGVPNYEVVSGGQVTALRLEHVWVEAWVDFYPSRGARNLIGDTWVPMDASFKQYTYTAGMSIPSNVPFDSQSLLAQIDTTATVNESEGWTANVDEPTVQNALASYQGQLQNYVEGQNTAATGDDVVGTNTIVQSAPSTLPAGLPYRVVAVGSSYASLPAGVRHTLQLDFYESASDLSYDNPSFTVERSMPAVAGHRISLIYQPASDQDRQTLASSFDNYQASFAAYAVDFQPVLRLEDQTLQTGSPTMTGTQQYLRVTMRAPGYSTVKDYSLLSGDDMVLAVNAAGVTLPLFNARTNAHDLRNGTDPNFTEEMFYQIGLGFWAEEEALSRILGQFGGVASPRLPSHAMAGAPVSVTYAYGVPKSATYNSRVLDVKQNLLAAVSRDDNQATTITFLKKRGLLGSYLEAGVYDQALMISAGSSISAATAIQVANEQGKRIYKVTQGNVNTVLPQLSVDSQVQSDIASATASGFEVTLPQSDITVGTFTGTGYVIQDPQTGAGQYLISGGRNGGSSPAPASVYPVPAVLGTAAIGLLINAGVLAATGTSPTLVTTGGMVTGIAIPVAAPVEVIVMLIVIATAVTGASIKAVDQEYPRTARRFRHYTDFNGFIYIMKERFIRASEKPGLTFGPGAYFADPEANPAINNVSCPLTSDQENAIEKAYGLDPGKGGTFIDIIITRDNFYKYAEFPSPTGPVLEVVFPPPGVYFGDGAFGAEFFQSCPMSAQ